MATTPTQLPVPSEKPQDLKFNAGKIDEFVTSMGWTYTDRFGVKHYTIEGLKHIAEQAISAFGYITMDSFEDGATLTLPNQVLRWKYNGEYYRWDGVFPKSVVAGSTPDSSGGIGNGKWLSVGDAALRNQLSGSDGYKYIGRCPDIATLRTIEPSAAGQKIDVVGYNAGTQTGGGYFIYDVNDSTTVDDGVVCFVTENGARWKRVINRGSVTLAMAGAKINGIDYDTQKLISCLATGLDVVLPFGEYTFECNKINVPTGARIYLESGAVITWVNNTGANGGSQQAWGFMAQNVGDVVIAGGTHKHPDDTMVVFAVQSGAHDCSIEHTELRGPRLIDVMDGANDYAVTTSATRPKNINTSFVKATTVTRSTTSALVQYRYTEGGICENMTVDGYYYAAMFWGGDSNYNINGAVGNERKCKNLTFQNIRANVVWAGIWGSMGDNIEISSCRVESLDPSHCDVGIDFEGCTNSRAYSCYAKNWANGGIATFFYNNQVSFDNCEIVVDNSYSRFARFYNAAQNTSADGIYITNCRWRGIGIVSAIVQMGAANNLVIRGNKFINCLLWLVANNNGFINVSDNNFYYDTVPYTNFNDYGIYAMMAIGGFHSGGSTASGAVPAAKAVAKDNWFASSVTFPAPSYANWFLHVGFNNTSSVEVVGGGTLSAGVVNDIGFVNAGQNAGISLRFSVKDFSFFNKSWTTELINSATLTPKGTVKGKTNLGVTWPNAMTDNVQYATTYFDVRQEFELITPTDAKRGDVVKTAGIGTAAVTRTY